MFTIRKFDSFSPCVRIGDDILRINWLTLLPTWIGAIAGLIILWGGKSMTTELWITLIVSAIGVIGSLIATFWQLKRDGKTIDSISSDTSEARPKIDNIDSTVKAMVTYIVRLLERSSKIESVASTVESFRYLKDRASVNPEEMLANMSKVFEENSALKLQHQSDQTQINKLLVDNYRLRGQLNSLEQELRKEKEKHSHSRDLDFEPEL